MKWDSSDCNLLCEVPPVLQSSRTALSPFLFIFLFLSKCWIIFLEKGMSLSISHIQLVFNLHRVKMRYFLELNLLLQFDHESCQKIQNMSLLVTGLVEILAIYFLQPTNWPLPAYPPDIWNRYTAWHRDKHVFREKAGEKEIWTHKPTNALLTWWFLTLSKNTGRCKGKMDVNKGVSAQHEISWQELRQLLQKWTFGLRAFKRSDIHYITTISLYIHWG